MLLQLGTSGEYDGKTIISQKQMNEIHKPQMVRGQRDATAPQATYGFGWSITDHKGKRVITHGGATDGFNTAMFLMPEIELGVIVVGNTFNRLGHAVAYQVMDAYLGEHDVDWNEYYLTNYKKSDRKSVAAREKIHEERVKKTKPSLSLDAYTGVYLSDGYG